MPRTTQYNHQKGIKLQNKSQFDFKIKLNDRILHCLYKNAGISLHPAAITSKSEHIYSIWKRLTGKYQHPRKNMICQHCECDPNTSCARKFWRGISEASACAVRELLYLSCTQSDRVSTLKT